MIEFLSPAVLAAVLRVSSSPIFSVRLAMASMRTLRAVPSNAVSGVAGRSEATGKGTRHV
ncbi:hypothetical protein SAMN05446635_6450 [Burkholderia sp. OK233]|nr:hypothetical protein SAMN05446635_6450 [Burkholderia sp. OK233]